VGTVDGFLDEDVDYALRLNHAGVPCELHVYPGACHGYQMATASEITQQSNRHVTEWLSRQLLSSADGVLRVGVLRDRIAATKEEA
jgi:acetyl esterase/lipase